MTLRHPSPQEMRNHIAVRGESGTVAAGATLTASTTYYAYIATAGAARCRYRGKFSNTVTVTLSPCSALDVPFPAATVQATQGGIGTAYTTGASVATAILAETKIDMDLYGEPFVEIKYVVGGSDAVISFNDLSQL